jgi:hypothetical protein
LSHERLDIAGAESLHSLEGYMCGTVMRGADALPGSKSTITCKGIASEPGRSRVWPSPSRALCRVRRSASGRRGAVADDARAVREVCDCLSCTTSPCASTRSLRGPSDTHARTPAAHRARSIKTGRVSAGRDEFGQWAIELCELHRLYPALTEDSVTGNGTGECPSGQAASSHGPTCGYSQSAIDE